MFALGLEVWQPGGQGREPWGKAVPDKGKGTCEGTSSQRQGTCVYWWHVQVAGGWPEDEENGVIR